MYYYWQWRSCWGVLLQQCLIQLVSELFPCVLLLAVEALLGCVAAAVLDSARGVSVGSLCIITGSKGPAGCIDVQCWIQLVSELVPFCIITGSRGPAGVCCCSSAGFS